MKKGFKYYSIIWTVLLILFNIIVFVPSNIKGIEKYTPSFWIGYAFITITFIIQLLCTYLGLRSADIKKTFYNVAFVRVSYLGLLLSFVFGGLCMLIPFPYWLSIVICVVILTINIINIVKTSAAVDLVSDVDQKIKVQTFFIKSLTVDAQGLVARARSEGVKAECVKVYEAIRYSDPMSNEALAFIDKEISVRFSKLSYAVADDNHQLTTETAYGLLILLDDRNKKCKLLK